MEDQDMGQEPALEPTLDELLEEQITNLHKCNDYTSNEAKCAYEALTAITEYIANNEDKADIIAAKLADQRYGSLFVEMWKNLIGFLAIKESKGFQNLRMMLISYRELSKVGFELGAELGESGCIPLLMDAVDSMRDVYLDTSEIMHLVLRILFNAIHKFDDNDQIYREANAVQILTRCLECEDEGVKLSCFLIMGYVVGEKQSAKIQAERGCMQAILKSLKEAVESEDHREASQGRFSAGEMLSSLNKLVRNDVNKFEMLKHGGIPLIGQMLQDNFDEQANTAAVVMVLNLAFVDAIRKSAKLQETYEGKTCTW